jgi:AraC-like DNA-binding protein
MMEKMKMHLKYDSSLACRVILQEHLAQYDISCTMTSMGKVELDRDLSLDQYQKLEADLKKYGIEFIENSRSALIQEVKEAIREYVYYPERSSGARLSTWISGKLNLSYSYLSRIFTEETGNAIENYMIIQRIERAKQLIAPHRMTFTEIAWELNFSSVAHLSNQFRKVTGLTPTQFQKLTNKPKNKKMRQERKSLSKAG